MPLSHRHTNAHYDANGDIVIEPEAEMTKKPRHKPRLSRHDSAREFDEVSAWTTTILDEPILRTSNEPENLPLSWPRQALRTLFDEGSIQLAETEQALQEDLKELREELHALPRRTQLAFSRMWRMALSPCMPRVTIGRKAAPRSRLTLFVFDAVRFGFTFAFIFGVLFVSVNFQSFWNIAKAELALTEDLGTVQALQKLTGGEAETPLLASAGGSDAYKSITRSPRPLDNNNGSLLAVLPPVGPPENRLIIPKIGKNVPIVIPSIDSLMNEDWSQFEKDIQISLRDGVVHYPGTARPGQSGNFFITGHSSYYPWDPGYYKDVFARLHELEPGDTYSVYFGGDLHTYRVTSKREVKPSDVSVLDQPSDKRIATLMTCTPIGTTLRRLIVQAEEVDPVTGKVLKAGQRGANAIRQPAIDMLPI